MDEQARQDFTEFAVARSRELIRLAYLLTGSQHAAEDLLQDALTRGAAHWSQIHSAPEAYIRRIMYRPQVSGWRRRARRPETTMAEVPESLAAGPATGVEERLALHEALHTLPTGKRPC